MTPFLVVMAGGSASGKTTVAREVSRRTGALLVGHDRYYHGAQDPRTFDFDHPSALDTARLVADLRDLLAARPVDLPVYDFARHARAPRTERVEPAPIIVVEGILVLEHAPLRELADLRVFVDAPADLRLVRRLRRDVVERGRTVDSVLDQYLATVRPSHEAFVEPCRDRADLVLDGTALVDTLALRLLEAIERRRAP